MPPSGNSQPRRAEREVDGVRTLDIGKECSIEKLVERTTKCPVAEVAQERLTAVEEPANGGQKAGDPRAYEKSIPEQ